MLKMIPSMKVVLPLLILTLLSTTSSLVIKSHWEHVRLKKVSPARVDGRKSGEIILTCSATGSPAPSIAWYKDDLFVPHLDYNLEERSPSIGETVAQLRLPCLSESDAGLYECRARAGKKEVSAVTEINVVEYEDNLCREEGQPEISMWRPTMMVEEGEVVVMPCRVKQSHDQQIIWTNGRGDELGNDVRFVVSDNGDLKISGVTWGDMGQYTCTANNLKGTTSVKTFLYPLAQGL